MDKAVIEQMAKALKHCKDINYSEEINVPAIDDAIEAYKKLKDGKQ